MVSKEERRQIAAAKYAERMAKRAEDGGETIAILASLAALGWNPDAIAADIDADPHAVRAWARGELALPDDIAALRDLLAFATRETS